MTEQPSPPHFPRDFDWLWLALTLSVILALTCILPLPPNDLWWYVRLGQEILRDGAIPAVEHFAYTQAGQPVFYQHWGSAVLLWLVYNTAGGTGLFLWRSVILGGVYGFLWLNARRLGAGPRLSTVLTLVLALGTSNNWTVRPQLSSYPLFVFALWLVWEWQHGRTRWLWTLPVLGWVWANLHGSFSLLFLLAGPAVLFGRGPRRALAFWLGLAFLAMFLNPYGPGIWVFFWRYASAEAFRQFITEWGPPVNEGWQMNLFFAAMLTFPLALVASPRRLPVLAWVWFLGFGWQAFSGMRFVVWTMFLLFWFTAWLIGEWSQRWVDRPAPQVPPALNWAWGGFLLLAPLALLPGVRERWWSGPPSPVYTNTPIPATQWLAARPNIPGELWADLTISSYLVFALPERLVWVDTRFEVFPAAQWADYQTIAAAAPGWEALLAHDNINLLFLAPQGQPNLIQAARTSEVWCLAYEDAEALIFTRRIAHAACPTP